jgi:hypothetical protein
VKKLLKVLGILVLTLAGVVGLIALYGSLIELAVPVGLIGDGQVNVGSWDDGYVSTMGTWASDHERHATPLNASDIRCYRDQQVCYEAQATIFAGYLSPNFERYPIVRWDNWSIEFGNDLPCVNYLYVIDRATQKLSGIRLKKDNTAEACGLIESDLRLSFVKGLDVVMTLRRENSPTALFLILGSGFVFLMLAWIWMVIRRKPRRLRSPHAHP